MMPTARVLTVTALLWLQPLQSLATGTAYKWVDDKGETHYAQTPPNDTPVEVIKVPSGSSPTYTAPPRDTPAEPTSDSNAPGTTAAAKAEDAAIREKNCSLARANLAALKNEGDVTIKSPDGLLHVMTPDERKSQTAKVEENIKMYCKD